MDIQNHFYGHSASMARYCDLGRTRHVDGLVQHGWVASSPVAVNFGDFPRVGTGADRRRLLVWSHTSRAWSQGDEERQTVAIGAPLLYALRVLQQLGAAERRDGPPLIVPLHSTQVRRTLSDPSSLAQFYAERIGPARVSLHSEDVIRPEIVRAWQAFGHEVVCAGDRFDPLFVYRILRGVLGSSQVVTNRLSTIAFYAIGVGVQASVWGPRELIEGETHHATDRLEQLWPELHEQDVPLSVSSPIAAEELGSGHVRTPAELSALLGWSEPVSLRAGLTYWAGAPVVKALNVLGVTQRDSAAAVVAPTTVSAPPWSAFLRHPLSHLPRGLPGVPSDSEIAQAAWLTPAQMAAARGLNPASP